MLTNQRIVRCAFFAALTMLLAACGQQDGKATTAAANRETNAELKWARGALERNPNLKIEMVDEAKQTIRVRVKTTGEVSTVTPGELAAIPIADLVALTQVSRVAQTETAPTPARVVEEPAVADPEPPAATREPNGSNYKVEREGGRVRISGPGVNIESTNSGAQAASTGALKRHDEPIICEGRRTLFLDSRRMNVEGDAIIARNGCEVHLTNSEIVATGTAIIVQDATVHVGNSSVQGGEASIEAAPNAKLFLQNSQFVGISRRDAQAKFTDQGGNTWR